jgi:hypothetical protein
MNNNIITKHTSVFMSHNKADNNIAREISIFLVAEGVSVWFDEWKILAGDSIVEEINTGLANCTHFIILWSVNASKSNWVSRELNSTLANAIDTNSTRVIPILLDNTPLPPLLSDFYYLRYTRDSETDRREIINAVTGHPPSNNLIEAIVKKYKEVIYDSSREGPFSEVACPECGSTKLEYGNVTDYKGDVEYYITKCQNCDWSDWTQ